MSTRDTLLNDVLAAVERPSRYLGTELNSVHKRPEVVELRVALAFPDLYDLGLGNLGLQILYHVLNDLPWCWAERAYAVAPDLEQILRDRDLPLFALESKNGLGDFDLLGFTLQSELTYTTVLNMLDLAGIPLRSRDRGEAVPLVVGGGPTAVNPEPMADFFDFFVIGEAESALVCVCETLRASRGLPRHEKLAALRHIAGVYVPAHYPTDEASSGRFGAVQNAPLIRRAVEYDMNSAPFPTDYIVPYAQQVHDRVALETHRGCTRGCRFCQAGMTTRPVRERDTDTIMRLAGESLDRSGYEELSLMSLSTCDHSEAENLVSRAEAFSVSRDVSVSLPSLRLDESSVELADRLAGIRRTGLTFAPETASPRLRHLINKNISEEQLTEAVCEAFRRGWRHVKLYFMIGLPTETDEDVLTIPALCERLLNAARQVNRNAQIHTGISTLVPKPFTPFQWAAQIDLDETRRRQRVLRDALRRVKGVKYGAHEPESTFVEGLVSRGDRNTAVLIEEAWRRGARLDTDARTLNFEAWQQALEETGFDVACALGPRDPKEALPWDHIDVGVTKDWLRAEWSRALEGVLTEDCRSVPCRQCGANRFDPQACRVMQDRVQKGKRSPTPIEALAVVEEEPPPAQRLRFRVGRHEEARFLSNLEWMALWHRALRRAKAPLSYSQGFHAHPKVTFSSAPPVGQASECEYMDVVLRQNVLPDDTLARLRAVVPAGIAVYETWEVPVRTESLMSIVEGFSYRILLHDGDADALRQRIAAFLESAEVPAVRRKKGKGHRPGKSRAVNVRPSVTDMEVFASDEGAVGVDYTTKRSYGTLAKPREIIEVLGVEAKTACVIKRWTFLGGTQEGDRK